MQKIYEGETLSQALLKMQIELGKDAIIVETKKVKKGGVLGVLGTEIYQVVALEPVKTEVSAANKKKVDVDKAKILDILSKKNKTVTKNSKLNVVSDDSVELDFKKNDETSGNIKSGYLINNNPYSKKNVTEFKNKEQNNSTLYSNKLNTEIAQLKNELKNISSNMAKIMGTNSNEQQIKYPGKLSELYMRLIENEIEENLADNLISELRSELKSDNELNNLELAEKSLERIIINHLPYSYKLDFNKKNKPYILVLAGPTGVGKTTSIAKLGAIYSLVLGKKIAFMTLDTYRLAAVEQLQKYAEILDVPLKIIFKPENFNSLLDDLNEYDIILVDTAGRNPKDEEQMMELKKFLNNTDKASETFLVVQATTKFSDLEEIIKRFENINFDKLLITKLDETITFGPIVNLLEKYKYDVSYITNGQEVPDAIEKFNPSKLAQAIIYKHPF